MPAMHLQGQLLIAGESVGGEETKFPAIEASVGTKYGSTSASFHVDVTVSKLIRRMLALPPPTEYPW